MIAQQLSSLGLSVTSKTTAAELMAALSLTGKRLKCCHTTVAYKAAQAEAEKAEQPRTLPGQLAAEQYLSKYAA